MLQGTGSDVGKSLLVAGLCRAAKKNGMVVRPFKPQNMSNNSAIAVGNGEVGRAQALQAKACGIEPTVDMNPILLKPETDNGAQIVIQGRMHRRINAREYQQLKAKLLPQVLDSFEKIREAADLVLIEGAGSTAEINLRSNDIANMGFALAANVPVVLVGDIDRGGVIANIVGTKTVLQAAEARQIKGFLINKFRGDISLFSDGLWEIERRTNWKGLGVVPWFGSANILPAEDAVSLTTMNTPGDKKIKISVPRLSRIANFDDLDPLRIEPDVNLSIVEPGNAITCDTDLIIIPGSKSTISDLAFLREQGWDIDIKSHVRRGGSVLGLCGGYQMLGRTISDPQGIEGNAVTVKGLELLNVKTELTSKKALKKITGFDLKHGERVTGYEIHIGRTTGPDCNSPVICIDKMDGQNRMDGASSPDGLVTGTYVHGLFVEDKFRNSVLKTFGICVNEPASFNQKIEDTLDDLADHLRKSIDVDRLFDLAR
tara:strand:+ start:214 stop:1671 length:1458 start_codon:yes stop_codon:yes gene_type:complete